ncbi:MAG: chromate transporter, partial [Clostridia bacterium]|nr:chromate transporter [Clostridia bacterium]
QIALFNTEKFSQTGKISDLFVLKAIILAAVLFILQKIFKKIHPIALIAIAAAAGIIFAM